MCVLIASKELVGWLCREAASELASHSAKGPLGSVSMQDAHDRHIVRMLS